MKKRITKGITPISFEELSKLVGNDVIKIEFFDDSVGLKNGSSFREVSFYGEGEDENDSRASLMGVLVNNCRNTTHFVIYANEIKRIYNSKGIFIWENPIL